MGSTTTATDALASPADPADLSALLRAAARGDTAAFASFVDATIGRVFHLELAHALAQHHADHHAAPSVRAVAEAATRRRYVEARRRAADQPTSGLSPQAWLLALPTSGGERP